MIDTAELDDRIVKCEKILAADANSQIFAAIAEAYRKKGDLQKAQEVCQKGLNIHPDYATARIVMAKIYLDKEDFDRAWDELRLGIKSSGRTRAMDILEAEILIKKGKIKEAKAIAQKLYLSDPQDETIKNLMIALGEENLIERSADVLASIPAQVNKTNKKLTLQDVLNIIRVTPRVLGVVAVNEQGLVIDGRFDGNISKDEAAALTSGIFDVSCTGSERISLGQTKEILIETRSSKLWLVKTFRFLLVIMTRDDVSMGSLKLKIEDLIQRVEYIHESSEQGGGY